MNVEVKKTLALLAGAFGVAVISVGMTLAAEKISAKPVEPVKPASAMNAANANTPINAAPVAMMGQVISVKPHYVTTMVPYRSCRQVQQVYYAQPYNYAPGAGAVLGGVTGGFIGNQFGHGRGRAAATVAGAVIGAVSGNAIEQNIYQPRPYASYSTICSKHYAKKIVQKGYEVTYVYNGQQNTAIMANPPSSDEIPLTLGVAS